MAGIVRLGHGQDFPPTSEALDYPNGLLAAGGDLSPERLLAAYRRGIFPWYEAPQPVLWWTPDPRSVLFVDELHIARSLRKTLRRGGLQLAVDQRFEKVMQACAEPRDGVEGTWIGADMLRAYTQLHYLGIAHSIEVLDHDGALVGGLYGISLGRVFFGESMFSRIPSASRIALVALAYILRRGGGVLIDCQVESAHMNTMGARTISRLDFEKTLAHTIDATLNPATWALPATCGDLLP
ncbi:leucyl/phenylalanyl-tRNA--protein transferase [Kineobactrum sediminis]|uniref:Leucyl/phenylalanyl-tRNA--protein transferase n=1 Tax=Kineobactrum sediminis TaxID=1905677 RepID=A0A2N5Y367_9GAMM|nr:leucyl/phenylalanyl-tRNA--protein transferase [Kineobactrum sediminis]PLW82828.1 leucyl/phenylalanyl-tRNA--protein transferase [Kineobactrum sediminis]